MADNQLVFEEVRRVSTKVDDIAKDVADVKVSVAVVEEKVKAREAQRVPERLDDLEKFRTKAISYATIISGAVSIGISIAMIWVKKFIG